MKKVVFVFLLSLIFSCGLYAQSPYISIEDSKHPGEFILNGIITKYALSNNDAYRWFHVNQQGYNPDTAVLNAVESAKVKFRFVVFGGTWCEDTQFILPRFFSILEQAGFPDKSVSFFAVDRNKQIVGNVAGAFNIINVPTIIVMKDGVEVGRVVEYGKTGKWDKEIATLLK